MDKVKSGFEVLFSKKNTWRIIFAVLLLFLVICSVRPSYCIQNDTFYVIKIGEQLLDNGFDMNDHWAWSAQIEITYPHLLLNVILAIIYRSFGFVGIYVFVLLISYFLALSIYYVMEKIHDMTANKEDTTLYPLVGFFVSTIVLALFHEFAVARSQLLTYILWLWEMWFLLHFLNSGLKRYGVGIIVLAWLCALTHSTAWYFTFILFIPFFAAVYISKLRKYISSKGKSLSSVLSFDKIIYSSDTECKNVKKLWIVFLLSYATGLLTPTRICYTSVFKINGGNPVKYINEFKPLSWSNGKIFIICAFLFIVLLLLFRIKCRLDLLFLFAGTFAMTLTAIRHIGLLVFVSSYALFFLIFSALRLIPSNIRTTIKNTIIPILTVLVFAVVGLANNQISNFTLLDPSEVPVEAVDFLEENYDTKELRLMNDYGFGAYMLFRDVPVFIDSRVNEYTKQFNPELERDVFDDYISVLWMNSNWNEIIDYYDFDGYLIQKTGPLYEHLSTSPSVEVVWEDDFTIIFMTKR